MKNASMMTDMDLPLIPAYGHSVAQVSEAGRLESTRTA